MKSQGNKTRDNLRCKEWERQRRDRLCEAFKGLAELLPNHDPAKGLPKISTLDKATQFIKELRLSNSRLLNQQTQADETSTKIKELQDEVNKLILRVRQLTRLLNQAKIPIPIGPFIKTLGKKPKKWTNQLTIEDLENSRRDQTACNQKCEESVEKGTPKEIENRLSGTTAIIISSPLKEANSGDVIGVPDKVDVAIPVPVVENTSNLPTSSTIPTIKNSSVSPTIEKSSSVIPPIIRTVNPPLNCVIQQPTTVPNISFPLQTSYILTRFPTQQPILTQFALGPNPRLILRKPPTSSHGNPKVAIPSLRREPKVVKKRAKRQPKSKVKNVVLAKSCQTDQPVTVPILSEVAEVAEVTDTKSATEVESTLLSNFNPSPEPQPILVDISGPIESEIESEEQIKITHATQSQVDPLPNCSKVDEIPETHGLDTENYTVGMSQQNESETVEEMDTTTISEEILVQNPVSEVESTTEITKTVDTFTDTNAPSEIVISESRKIIEDLAKTHSVKENTLPEIDTQKEIQETQSNPEKHYLECSTKIQNQFLQLKNIENFESSSVMEECDQVEETDSCINADKISECIARSIDLIDHPEAELMELGADWGVVGVGESSHSPKSPISPTQMFLSMFPLLPRESIVTAAVGVEHEQASTPHSGVKNSNSASHFCSISSRSSFFIDSMLPEQGQPQTSGSGSTCLAVTPITPSCLQQSLNNNYSSPPSFQSLANVVSSSHNSNSARTVSSMKPPLPLPVPSSVSSGFFQNTSSSVAETSPHLKIQQSPSVSTGNFSVTTSASSSSYSSCLALRGTGTEIPSGNGTGSRTATASQKRSYQQHTATEPTQQFYTPETPRLPLPATTNSAAHSISQLFNPFVNHQRRQQSIQIPFNDNYSYYPQEPLYTPQNPVPIPILSKYPTQNNNSRMIDCSSHSQQQSNDDPRNRRLPVPESQSRSQQQTQSAIFRPASNVFSQTGSNLNTATISQLTIPQPKHSELTEKQQRSNISNKASAAPHNPNNNTNTMDYRNTSHAQTFSPTQYTAQPSPAGAAGRHSQYQIQGVPDPSFNFMSNSSHQRQEAVPNSGTAQNSSHFENKNLPPRSFPRSVNNPPKQTSSSRTLVNTEFNADFLAYSAQPTPSQGYQGNNRQPTAHCPYDISTSSSIVSEKPPYRASGHAPAPMQQQPLSSASKTRQPPFYLPDPPPPSMPLPIIPSQPQYESTNAPPNYSSQQPIRQQQHSHYSNNFVPQFYNSRSTTTANVGGTKEYQFSNPHPQNITKPAASDFYQNHTTLTSLPPQQQHHQQQAVEPPVHSLGPLSSKKSVTSINPPNFGVNNNKNPQQSTRSRGTGSSVVLTQNQPNQPSQISARPVNWMTDPQPASHKKPSTSGHSTTNNPFSVSKLVGNNSNNYCTEALIRKNPNPDWNDFHCFLPSTPVPPVPTSSSLQLPPQPVTFSSQPQLQPQSQPPIVHNEYLPHNPYHGNTNFGNFDPHNFQHHYNISSQMNNASQNHGLAQGQGQGHGNANIPHGGSGTTTSVSNFNLSSIFPEMNDKRGNNNNSGGNCGYYGSNNGSGK